MEPDTTSVHPAYNANDGLTVTTPWQTVQYAEAHATNAGDIIELKRGDIRLTDIALGTHHGGISGNPITWDGALWGSGANAIIRSSADRPGSILSIVNIIGCSYVTFQNISVDGNNTFTFGLSEFYQQAAMWQVRLLLYCRQRGK